MTDTKKYTLKFDVSCDSKEQADRLSNCIDAIIKNIDLKLIEEINPESVGKLIGNACKSPFQIKMALKFLK